MWPAKHRFPISLTLPSPNLDMDFFNDSSVLSINIGYSKLILAMFIFPITWYPSYSIYGISSVSSPSFSLFSFVVSSDISKTTSFNFSSFMLRSLYFITSNVLVL